MLLTACTVQPKQHAAPTPPGDPVVVVVQAAPAQTTPPSINKGEGDPNQSVLAYADRVRLLSPTELAADIARLNDKTKPVELLEQALALSQQRQLPELLRAQEAVARVLASSSTEAQALHPLARLLATRFAEQRRFEEQAERQNQALRDVQRKLEQTNERLEALKAIERSLSNRPPTPPASAAPSRAPASKATVPPSNTP